MVRPANCECCGCKFRLSNRHLLSLCTVSAVFLPDFCKQTVRAGREREREREKKLASESSMVSPALTCYELVGKSKAERQYAVCAEQAGYFENNDSSDDDSR